MELAMEEEPSEEILTLLNEFIDSQRFVDNKVTEYSIDLQVFDKLLNNNRERIYNSLDQETASTILSAIDGLQHPTNIKIECSHCEEIFSHEDFQQHVCLFDENHVLIPMEEVPEPQTELQNSYQLAMEVLSKNRSGLKDLLKDFNPKDGKSKSSNFECSKCCRKFVHESGLYRHWDKHIGELIDPSPELSDFSKLMTICNVCHEVFGTESEGWDHYVQKRHCGPPKDKHEDDSAKTGESPIQAPPYQNLEVSRRSTFQCPLRSVNVSKLFQCEFCDLVFVNGLAMFHHVSMHDPTNAFECNKCELKNLSLKDILLHRRDECINFRDFRNPFKDFCRVWACNVCDEEFRGLELLLDHRYKSFHFFPRISARKNELLFTCERCVIYFKTAPELVDHLNDKHFKKEKPDAIAETSERIQKTQTTRKGGVHQTSTRARHYLCEVCGKSYTQSSHLWQHLRFHQGVKPFACSVEGCDRRFTIRSHLNDHIRKCHTGERPYLCTLCGKRFLTGSVYYQHRLIHRGERRYRCEECGKSFYRADALKNHLRIHSGEKPHTCSECSRGFRQRGDRDKHVKARHPNAVIIPSPKKQSQVIWSRTCS